MNEYIQTVIDEGIDVPCAVDEQNKYVRKDGIVGTLTTDGSSPKHNNRVIVAAAMRGRYNEDGQVEQHLEVSDREVANTVTTVQKDSLVAEPCIIDDMYANRTPRIYTDYAPSLRSERVGLKVAEPNVLVPKRTEYGKAIRKAYEAGEIQESRHNMTELVPREDGITNTLTTVQKDNYVVEPSFVNGDICKTVRAGGHGSTDRHSWDMVECNTTLRIRKLTPKECFRLQGFDDESFHKAEAVNSNTQLYKQAGNSICVPVVEYIIKALVDCGALEKEKENKEMELKMNDYQLPEEISFNFEELKAELTEKVSMYETMVYTDDQIKEAKADKANLNKLKKALNDERIRREKEYMVPFNDSKTKINEIISIIDKPVAVIDQQVKAYEDKQKQDKLDNISTFFNETDHPEWLHIAQIMNDKWLNASTSMKSVQEEITAKLEQISTDITTLSNLPEFGFEAVQVYKSTLDINKAISEAQRMSQIAKAKAEAEAKKAAEQVPVEATVPVAEDAAKAPVQDVSKQWIKFQALMSIEDAVALKAFFNGRNIEFKAI